MNTLLACAPSAPAAPAPVAPVAPSASGAAPSPTPVAPGAPQPPDFARGGRLYDSWRTERKLSSSLAFDSAATPELDGRGGPNGNGTLNDGRGRPMPNTGHDYRLRSFFGWDLRGKQGVSGPRYLNESHVLDRNLLEDQRSPEEIRRWLEQGD